MSDLEQDRPRFIRACDRCRTKKIKCDDKQPCTGCEKTGIECTFELSHRTPVVGAPSSSRKRKATAPLEQEHASSTSAEPVRPHAARTSSSSSASPTDLRHGIRLDLASSSHFFLGHDGVARMIGPTSGIALLDAARLISRTKVRTRSQPEHEWAEMARLLGTEDPAVEYDEGDPDKDDEYFPDRQEKTAETNKVDVFAEITSVVPHDLLASLVSTFFIHSSWPLIHPPTFFDDLYKWSDPSCGMLVVAMCMLASRYTVDPRVLSDPKDPACAGRHYHSLFQRLANYDQGDQLYQVLAYLFVAQFFCTDNVPERQSAVYFGMAFAKHVDMGLHRSIPSDVPMSDTQKEMRKRTGWAIYCWDKQIAALFGRHPFNRLFQISIQSPSPFSDTSQSANFRPLLLDELYVEIFRSFISITAVLDFTLNHVSPHAALFDSPFLDLLASKWNLEDYEEGLGYAEEMTEKWIQQLPPSLRSRDISSRLKSNLNSVASEQVAGTEMLIKCLIYGRRLFLATVYGPGEIADSGDGIVERGQALRRPLMKVAKDLVQSCVQIGANGNLGGTDILFAYRVLVAGRLLLSCCFVAQADGDRKDAAECRRAVQAALMLLNRLAEVQPIFLGAAETLEETCRICSIGVETPNRSKRNQSRQMIWYRPFRSGGRNEEEGDRNVAKAPNGQPQDNIELSDFVNSMPLSNSSETEQDIVGSFLRFNGSEQDWDSMPGNLDLSWLLPAGLGEMPQAGEDGGIDLG